MLLLKSDVPSRWVKQIPIKVNVLAWKISMDRLPTRINLHRRGVQVSPISCPICCEALENLDHLLFYYDLAKDIARSICNWWGFVWNPVDSYRSWLSWFNLVQLQSSSKQVLEGVFYTSWWSIWSYRNHLLFSDSNPRKDGVWVPNGKKLLIISVYAPKELNEKKMWDYISHVMSNWKGDVVIMGDFNEVRKKAKRFGSVFNVQGADAFNLFISNAGLDENNLNFDQQADLECEVTKEELKRAVWDCGIDKTPGPDGQILDGPFILNELLQWCKSKKKHSLVFKVDFEKAYDSVRWDYLDDILRKFGFGEKCLYVSFQRVVDAGMFKDITLGSSLYRSHMFYAGDAIFVARKIVCVTLKTPFSYLGSKVGGLMSRVQSWNETQGVERVGKKPIFVKWKNVLASKEKDGLGVSSLYALNRALMFKWVWRFFSHSSSLWARVIKAIHGEDGKIGKKSLCTSIDVASKMAQSNLGHSFRRGPRGGEEHAQFDLMLEKVEGTSLINMRDRWVWSLEGSGEFFVASIRRLVEDYMLAEVTSKTHWMKAVPIMVNVLAWKVKLDCLTTRLNISRRGMNIESIICHMCGDAAESTRHIFFTCQIAREILHKISRWWDVSYTEVSSYEEWLDWILNLWLSVKYKQIFEGVCYVMWWHIWSFRNKSIFGSEYPSKAVIFLRRGISLFLLVSL
uniref:RNA-directed DNA polymerase, eukaryota n=1 Tax=Tanacetum cinerariifolium TaxID=118510 RepID=A0A699IT56_TANCI|nr:RNA-directed DNA polymerase, eukaryota [Tanacetum cinerariifolium]